MGSLPLFRGTSSAAQFATLISLLALLVSMGFLLNFLVKGLAVSIRQVFLYQRSHNQLGKLYREMMAATFPEMMTAPFF